MSKSYNIGYKKPPKHAQFKKGQSGNPNGRRKGSRNFSTDAKEVLRLPVRVNSDGKQRSVSSQMASLLRLREKALKNNDRALEKFIDLARIYNDDELAEAMEKLGATDAEILKGFEERLLRHAGKSKADPNEGLSQDAGSEPDAAQEDDDGPDEDDEDAWLK